MNCVYLSFIICEESSTLVYNVSNRDFLLKFNLTNTTFQQNKNVCNSYKKYLYAIIFILAFIYQVYYILYLSFFFISL